MISSRSHYRRTLELRVSSMRDLYRGTFNSADEIMGIEISAERLNCIKSDLLVKYAISNIIRTFARILIRVLRTYGIVFVIYKIHSFSRRDQRE